MKPVRSILPVTTMLVLLPMLAAQEPEAQSVPPPDSTLMTFDFAGGDIGQYVQLLRKQSGTVNILLSPGSDDVAVPPVSLQNVTVSSALDAISRLLQSRDVAIQSHEIRSRGCDTVYVVRVETRSLRSPSPDEQTVQVFSLKELTDALPGLPDAQSLTVSSDTVLTAIDTAFGVSKDGAPKPTVRYHRDSGLLFVQGTAEQISLVQQVLSQMQSSLERFRSAAMRQQNGAAKSAGQDKKSEAPKKQAEAR